MEFLNSSLTYFVYFGAGNAFFYSILEFVKKTEVNTTLVAILCLTGSILLRYSWYFEPEILAIPYVFFLLFTSITLVGPLVYVYVKSHLQKISDGNVVLKKIVFQYWFHFVPALLFFLFEILYFFQESDKLRELIVQSSLRFQWDWIHLATFIACIQVSFYSILCLRVYRQISSKYEIYELKLVWAILLLPVFANVLIGTGFFFKDEILFKTGAGCISGIILLLFVLRENHPGFFNEMSVAIQNSKYQNTILLSEEIEQANVRLNDLMEKKSFYRDGELRLVDLAAGLGLSLHQTSRYLNEVHRMSFYELINHYRVKEACKLLIEEPHKGVLDIGFEVGFNSKSAFNSQFLKATGFSPALYRKNQLQEKKNRE
ncbi:AraC family transcriptional regulator [Leptospira tipperaryensis]|uniref:AraC family transcriptional regulator n=1 Tax=Leptospira tipperaryensis TaxID=2564040 RepID=A0A1D7V0Z1_9LEPT|nr:helix-turn-helix domain-containing protein [Leptospira tipperaryensis]AOP35501.1 AraC family transcriptional regulator [Leptospira tipperaryensis]